MPATVKDKFLKLLIHCHGCRVTVTQLHCLCPAAWNSLPAAVQDLSSSSSCFCSHLKTELSRAFIRWR